MKRKITQNGLFLFHADEQPRKEVSAINSFMSWIGGKKALRDEILLRFPLSFERYIEVFGGGGWVLFHKPPGREMEVYNDFNPNLVNLYRCVREHPEELIGELTFVLNSRLDFDYVREMLHTKTNLPDVKRAAYFYQLIRQSYASGLDSFGAQPSNMWNNFPQIRSACERLQKVVIENKDFEKLIKTVPRRSSTATLRITIPRITTKTSDSQRKITNGWRRRSAESKESFCFPITTALRSGRFTPSPGSPSRVRADSQTSPKDTRAASSTRNCS